MTVRTTAGQGMLADGMRRTPSTVTPSPERRTSWVQWSGGRRASAVSTASAGGNARAHQSASLKGTARFGGTVLGMVGIVQPGYTPPGY